VDDEEFICELLEDLLREQGLRTRRFHDAESAWETFQQADPKPQLLVTDFQLINMNGLELIALCRRLSPGLRVILASGSVDPRLFEKTGIRPDCFLPKPFTPEQLMAAMAKAMKA
jgi:DNA-binding NtrC family response regulator